MAEYSQEDAAYARRIVERLLNNEAEGLELESDLAVSDVESDAGTFSNELLLLEDFNSDVPAVKVADDTVPVSLQTVFGQFERWPLFVHPTARPWRRHPVFYEAMYDLLQPFLKGERQFDGFTSMNRNEARATFVRRAADFVATRIASLRDFRSNAAPPGWPRPSMLTLRQLVRGPQIATPGCHFTVSTNSSGLRVFWSGAYYLTPNNFNHPTTPTSSVLQSGTFIFGVDGGAYGNRIQWDLNLVVTLPGVPYAHLNF